MLGEYNPADERVLEDLKAHFHRDAAAYIGSIIAHDSRSAQRYLLQIDALLDEANEVKREKAIYLGTE